MKGHILTTKNGSDIINVEHTQAHILAAQEYLKGLSAKGGVVLFVGTKPEAKAVVEKTALALGMPYIVERWVGGILTNWPEIKKRIAKLEDLRGKREKGELDMYTKKERLLIDAEIGKMQRFFGGLVGMTKIPDAVLVVDSKEESIAIKEAAHVHIPSIALMNTDTNKLGVTYPIVGNDASRSSITHFIEEMESALKSGTMATATETPAE